MTVFCPRCGAEFRQTLMGTWFETAVSCAECGLTLADPPLMLARGSADDEVDYSLSGWLVADRATATAALAEVDIPYRWEPELVLVVPSVAEEEVDQIFEDLGSGEELAEGDVAVADDDEAAGDDEDGEDEDGAEGAEDDEDGGEEAQAAMADLFVAADRLQHDPSDLLLADRAFELSAVIAACAPPYGIARPVWRRIQTLASRVATGVEEGADEEALAADSRALRDFLRDLV